jgi:hypothetical protein
MIPSINKIMLLMTPLLTPSLNTKSSITNSIIIKSITKDKSSIKLPYKFFKKNITLLLQFKKYIINIGKEPHLMPLIILNSIIFLNLSLFLKIKKKLLSMNFSPAIIHAKDHNILMLLCLLFLIFEPI